MNNRVRHVLAVGLILGAGLPSWGAGGPKKKELVWLSSYPVAAIQAHQGNRLILAYFTGSDWSPWDRKLDDEVLNTDAFGQWADKNVVLLKLDLPRDRHLNETLAQQNDKLKDKYNVGMVPTLLFLDPWGEIVARAGYDEARLRDDELQGHPDGWLKFCDNAAKNRPPDETIIEQKSLVEAMAYSRKHYLCLLILAANQKGATLPYYTRQRDELLKCQPFVRFVNRNLAFVQVAWPAEDDVTAEAVAWRAFAEKFKIASLPEQLIFWDFAPDKVLARVTAFDVQQIDGVIDTLTKQLPHPDYAGKWLDDFRSGQAIAAQQKKPLLLLFTAMDSSEYCQALDREIVQTEAFKDYARKSLVCVKIDFPKRSNQPQSVQDDNRRLADLYGVRGYPSIVVLNYRGQHIGDAKYQKGGPEPFVVELDALVQADTRLRNGAIRP